MEAPVDVVGVLTARVAAFMREHRMARRGEAVLAMVSGGPDSVCLLSLLRDIGAAEGFAVAALHVEHGIRGEASAGDMAFTQALCGALGVPLRVERVAVPAMAATRGQSLEVAAREARMAAARRAQDAFCARVYATGHHLDDQLETVLLHMARGAGLDGLRGMMPVNGCCIRPLLCISRAEVMAYLRARGLEYRVDESNEQPFTPRNVLRARVLGPLREINPALPDAVARMTEALRVDAQALDALADAAYGERFASGGLDIKGWEKVPEAVRRRVLMRAAAALGGRPEHEHVRALDAAALKGRGALSLPGAELEVSGGVLKARAPAPTFDETELRPPCEIDLGGACVISARYAERPFGTLNERYTQYFDARALEGRRLTLRPYRQGERVRPFGGAHHRLVSDIFTDMKVPASARAAVPLLCADGEPLWIAGVRRLAGAEIVGDTARALVVQYKDMRK